MKPSNHFKATIEAYIKQQADFDPLFAPCLEKEGKNIDDCCTYILNWVKKSGENGFSDDEIFGQAIHYYQEDDIKVGEPINSRVVVNHTVELTEEEKRAAKQAAIDIEVSRQREIMTKRTSKKEAAPVEQASLF